MFRSFAGGLLKVACSVVALVAAGSLGHIALHAAPAETPAVDAPAEEKPKSPKSQTRGPIRHQPLVAQAKKGNVDLLFLGDSITQRWSSIGKDVWNEYYGARKPMNAGISGDRTQSVLWRLEDGEVDGLKPKLVVLMIGTNNTNKNAGNTSEEVAAGVKAIVESLRAKLPESKILVLGIFPRGPNAADPFRQKGVAANKSIEKLADNQQVFYLDISGKFLEPDGTISTEVMPDLIHLSPRGYEIWAEAMEPTVVKLMGE